MENHTSNWSKTLLYFLTATPLLFSSSCKSTGSNDKTGATSNDIIEISATEDPYITYHIGTYFGSDGEKHNWPVYVVKQNGKFVLYDNDVDYSEYARICQLMHWVDFEFNWDKRSNKNEISQTEFYLQLPDAIEAYVESGGDIEKNLYLNKLIDRTVYDYGFWDWNPCLSERAYNKGIYNVHYNKRTQQMVKSIAKSLTEEWGTIVLQNGDTVPNGTLVFDL